MRRDDFNRKIRRTRPIAIGITNSGDAVLLNKRDVGSPYCIGIGGQLKAGFRSVDGA